MKRFHTILTLVVTALLGLATFTLTACSGDEAEDPAQTKADLLRAKAKAFAKKYGVDMSLNEDNIEQIAESLTVEQMEQDFKNFAELKKSLAQQSLTATTPLKAKAKTRGLKIRKTAPLEEEAPPQKGDGASGGLVDTDRYKEHKGSYKASKFIRIEKNNNKYVWIELIFTLSWHYKLNGNDTKGVQITTGSSSFVSCTHNIVCYFSTGNGFEVYGHGTVWVQAGMYNRAYSCYISWIENPNQENSDSDSYGIGSIVLS